MCDAAKRRRSMNGRQGLGPTPVTSGRVTGPADGPRDRDHSTLDTARAHGCFHRGCPGWECRPQHRESSQRAWLQHSSVPGHKQDTERWAA